MRSVAVVDGRFQVPGFRFQVCEGGELVLRKGFGWEEIKRTRFWVLKHGCKDRQVVGESLSAGGTCGEDDIFMRARLSPCGELVGVKLVNAAGG